jgi:hypothetical protein
MTNGLWLAAYQKKVKEAIFIKEIARAKQERDAYLAEIDRAKKLKAILDRREAVRPFYSAIANRYVVARP